MSAVTTHDRAFGRYLEDFTPGDIYKHWPGKTITEYDDHLFCMITMNHHPLHTNAWFAENEAVHGKNVVVGNLVYSLVLGMSVPDVSGSCIANLEVESLSHKQPTFHGDTIYAETRVLDKAKKLAKEHAGQLDSAVEKAADVVDKRTGKRYTDKIRKGEEATRKAIDKLDDEQPPPSRHAPGA